MWFRPKNDGVATPPPGWNVPPAHPNTTGGANAPWVPKGMQAPANRELSDDGGARPQRISERIVAFSDRLPMQKWLRQQRTVLVTEMRVDANKLGAPGGPNRVNYGAADDAGWATRTNSATSSPSIGGESLSATRQGKYLRDYSLQTYQARAAVGTVYSPPMFLNQAGINDIQTQVDLNGMYSVLNANQAAKYMNLRAPSPWENVGGC